MSWVARVSLLALALSLTACQAIRTVPDAWDRVDVSVGYLQGYEPANVKVKIKIAERPENKLVVVELYRITDYSTTPITELNFILGHSKVYYWTMTDVPKGNYLVIARVYSSELPSVATVLGYDNARFQVFSKDNARPVVME